MNQPNIVIVDYDVGNTHSVWNSITCLGYRRLKISNKHSEIAKADAIVLPGVGAFGSCIQNLRAKQLDSILNEEVLIRKKPILGICVGMQLMAENSEENGLHSGLSWIPGRVRKLNLPTTFAVPHVGWNDIRVNSQNRIFSGDENNPHFYFDHSYHFECADSYKIATCDYHISITAAIRHDNIYGVQFHPEKSQTNGLKLFRRFFESLKLC
jgi:glutamine amidotransferase